MTSTAESERTLAPISIIRHEPRTLEDQISQFEQQLGCELSAEQRARFVRAQPYKVANLPLMHDRGVIDARPQHNRVLIRAILVEDASLLSMMGEFAGHALEFDSRKCIANRIEAIGDGVWDILDKMGVPDDSRQKRSLGRRFATWISGRGVRHFARPAVGDHCYTMSTVANRLSKTDMSARLFTVPVEDIESRWLPP